MGLSNRLSQIEKSMAGRPCRHCRHRRSLLVLQDGEPVPKDAGRCIHCGATWQIVRIVTVEGGFDPSLIGGDKC
jgi:hypothetical protein